MNFKVMARMFLQNIWKSPLMAGCIKYIINEEHRLYKVSISMAYYNKAASITQSY